ncbi:MAG TPA: amidohydrolase [Bacteroidia bacterium]|nr:amidohydrolase [Bacteroidia bacterium]
MKNLRIALAQTRLYWEHPEANRNHFEKLFASFPKGSCDLILLPEMFSTGFTMNAPAVAETMDGPTATWMKYMAKKHKAVFCGSVVIKEKGRYFNRLLWVTPDGTILKYDKRHLFRMAKEEQTYSSGQQRLIVELKGWKICPLICYDLRFPVWCRNTESFDLQLFVANWPSRRKFAWKQLLVARAIENQCFVAGLNRVGKDGSGYAYSGDSIVHGPAGETILKMQANSSGVAVAELDFQVLKTFRKAFPVALDRDTFQIK